MIRVLDSVITAIADQIATHPPERGGALLGPIGIPAVTRFLFDPHAHTTHSTYRPSVELNQAVQQAERDDHLEFKGMVHSHPGGLDHPSSGDLHTLGIGLTQNLHLPGLLAPIVSVGSAAAGLHEVSCGPGKISFYLAARRRESRSDDSCAVVPMPVEVVPLMQDMERIAARFGGVVEPEVLPHAALGPHLFAGRVRLPGLELLLLYPFSYPATPPVVLATVDGSDTEQIGALSWRLDLPPDVRLGHALEPHLEVGPGPYRKGFGPRGGAALTLDPGRAGMAGWAPIYTGHDPTIAAQALRDGLFARSAGILAATLQERTVLIVGAGSGGSYTAEQLVRSGVGRIILIDPDTVRPENLSRTPYSLEDVGRPKVRALARRLLSINPLVDLDLHSDNLRDLLPPVQRHLVERADLILAATDDLKAQRQLGRLSYAQGKPMIAGGLYAGARGGEVIVTVPDRTACFLCATAQRQASEEAAGSVARPTDYGTSRLVGEMALGVDVQHVAGASVKMALALLLQGDSDARLARFLEPQIQERASYVAFGMTPDFWFFPQIFAEAPGQYAWQSVWMQIHPDPACPVCGDPEQRTDPQEDVAAAPGLDDILAAAHTAAEGE